MSNARQTSTGGRVDIGIVAAALNMEGYLERFFSCLRAQTYQGFRLVLVDDGSSDGTSGLCLGEGSWLGERLCVLRNERNLGPGPARNRGLDELCLDPPEYVTFLDVDDWFEPTYLEDLHEAAERSAADIVIAGIVRFEEESGHVLATEMVGYRQGLVADSSRLDELASINTCLYAKLYRFEPIRNVRFRRMRRSEDTCWLFEALPHLKTVKFTNHALYHYCVRAGSLSGAMDEGPYQDMHRVFAEQLRLFESGVHAPYRELFECQVFIRSSVGGVMRLARTPGMRPHLLERDERAWLDERMPRWRTNKYLSFGRWRSTSAKQLALKICALLYKCHLFVVFVVAYELVVRVTGREVRA